MAPTTTLNTRQLDVVVTTFGLRRIRSLMRSPRLWIGILAIVGALSFAPSANAAKARGSVNIYAGPTPYAKLLGGTWPNAYLTMHCWVDWAWANGTNRWFLVSGAGWNPYSGRPNWLTGYANANQVADQQRVRHC